MNTQNTSLRYGKLLIGLHWLTLLLLVLVYASIEFRELYPKGSEPREALKTWHFMLGLIVFMLTSLRLVARFSSPTPAIVPRPSLWQSSAASVTHAMLYLILLGLPLAGWLYLSAAGKPIPFFGFQLPPLIAPDKTLSGSIKEIHQAVGTFGYFLIGLHAAAALFHHHFMHDNTLLRMLPSRRTATNPPERFTSGCSTRA